MPVMLQIARGLTLCRAENCAEKILAGDHMIVIQVGKKTWINGKGYVSSPPQEKYHVHCFAGVVNDIMVPVMDAMDADSD